MKLKLRKLQLRPTATLGICLAAGLVAGIGLARPATTGADGQPPADQAQIAPAPAGADGYGRSNDPTQAQGSAQAPESTQTRQTEAAAITISGFDFGQPLVVAPGQALSVTNADGVAHTLTSDLGAFDTGNIGGGSTTGFTAPIEPGSFEFFCSIHPSMQGSLTVSG